MNLHQTNRDNLMRVLNNGLIIVTSGEEKQRNSDVNYRFRQDSDFLYLTGIEHPGHALVLDPKRKISHLFIPDFDRRHQIWLGAQLTATEARRKYGVDSAHHFKDFAKIFTRLKSKYSRWYGFNNTTGVLRKHKLRNGRRPDGKALRVALNELRVRKSTDEIKAIRLANRISHRGHIAIMKALRPGMYEFEAQALLEQEFLRGGAMHYAYPSIVASGGNAAILHYHENTARCHSGELLLVDAGSEWRGYGSDVTRTVPVSGRYSAKQRAIYDIVLEAQNSGIAMVKPGVSVMDLHMHACRVITRGLMRLGILKNGDIESAVKRNAHAVFFPHGIGHLLGLDVHDVGARDPKAKIPRNKPKTLRATRVLEPGFVITVEPGIYFIDAYFDAKDYRKEWARFVDWRVADRYRSVGGIRIEDDVLVTPKGHENLTTVPKEAREIERIMGGR